MARTNAVKIFSLAVVTAAIVVFGPSLAQADDSAPAGTPTTITTPTPSPTATDNNNPWD